MLGEPEVVCKPADDYLPQPQAVMITPGYAAGSALAKGISRPFAPPHPCSVPVPQTCIVGYNKCALMTK